MVRLPFLRSQVPTDQYKRCFMGTPGLKRLFWFVGTLVLDSAQPVASLCC